MPKVTSASFTEFAALAYLYFLHLVLRRDLQRTDTAGVSNEDITPLLGRRVAALRHQRGMSQQDLAEGCGLTIEGISRIERATREPRIGTLARLADGLGVTLAELVNLELPPKPPLRHRADADALASLLDDKPAQKVAFIARFAALYLDEG